MCTRRLWWSAGIVVLLGPVFGRQQPSCRPTAWAARLPPPPQRHHRRAGCHGRENPATGQDAEPRRFRARPPARCGEGLEMTEALGRSRGQRVMDVACEMLVGQARNCGERHRMQMPVASAWFRKVNLPKHIRALSRCSTRLLLRPPCCISTCYNLFPMRLY
jgi:hypothetical protein